MLQQTLGYMYLFQLWFSQGVYIGTGKQIQGLDLGDRVPEEIQTEFCNIVQEVVNKTIPKKKKCKKAKWLSEEDLQIAEKRSKRQRRKGKLYPSEYRVPVNSKER